MRAVMTQVVPFMVGAVLALGATGEPQWKAIPVESLAVRAGSALDCSRLVSTGPAGREGRVIVGSDGHLAFEHAPDRRVKFFGFSGHGVPECRTHAEVDALVAAIRTQGYNLVRPHFLDMYLMAGAREDLEFDPGKLDLFFYYVARLKENGIYLFLDAMTSGNGYRAVQNPWRVAPERDLGLLLYHDAGARAHWEQGVRKLLTTRNPHTGLALAEDPAVAFLLFYNEQEIRPGSVAMTGPWQQFLRRKYGSIEALRAAWKDAEIPNTDHGFAAVPIYSRKDVQAPGTDTARTADIAEFLSTLKTGMLRWYMERIRAAGYPGLVTHYDFQKALYLTPIRAPLPVVTMHNYHDHPSGETQTQDSALADAANWWRTLISTRFTGRPFLVSEYGHVYCNRHRYEEGLVVGGYAALQDIDVVMAHQQPVKREPQPMRTFHVGYDPILRAGQFLTGFLFQRGDAAPARHRVTIAIGPKELADPGVRPLGLMNSDQSRIALVTGLGVSSGALDARSGTAPTRGDVTIGPAASSAQIVEQYFATALDRSDGSFDLAGFVAGLKGRGLLSRSNRTDPARGIYESETGELLLDAPAKRLTVRTPRLEGAAFAELAAPLPLGRLRIEECSGPATVALVAVDDRPLAESRRLVLVFATDARNSGMTFADDEGRRIVKPGGLPVLVRTATVRLRFSSPGAASLKLWPLALNGTRRAEVALRVEDGAVEVHLDTAALPDGPATFYEFASEAD